MTTKMVGLNLTDSEKRFLETTLLQANAEALAFGSEDICKMVSTLREKLGVVGADMTPTERCLLLDVLSDVLDGNTVAAAVEPLLDAVGIELCEYDGASRKEAHALDAKVERFLTDARPAEVQRLNAHALNLGA